MESTRKPGTSSCAVLCLRVARHGRLKPHEVLTGCSLCHGLRAKGVRGNMCFLFLFRVSFFFFLGGGGIYIYIYVYIYVYIYILYVCLSCLFVVFFGGRVVFFLFAACCLPLLGCKTSNNPWLVRWICTPAPFEGRLPGKVQTTKPNHQVGIRWG